jgi:hypothetical protein
MTPELHLPNLVGSHNKSCLENLICRAEIANVGAFISEPIEISDFLTLDGASENVRVIECHPSVSVGEVISSAGCVSVRGEVIIKILCCDENEADAPKVYIRKAPFTNKIECDGIDASFECSCFGIASDVMNEVEKGGIETKMCLMLYGHSLQSTDVQFIADSYSTEKECKHTHSNLPILNAVKCSNGALTQSDILPLDELGLSQNAKIIDVYANAHTEEICFEKSKLCLKGKCDYTIIYLLEGDYSCKEVSVPFKYEAECKNDLPIKDSLKWWSRVDVSYPRARVDGERLFLDCELNFNVFALFEASITVLNEIIFGQSRNKSQSELRLCYPERGASLWSVAKEYGVPVSKIQKRNSIPENETSVNRRFLIV